MAVVSFITFFYLFFTLVSTAPARGLRKEHSGLDGPGYKIQHIFVQRGRGIRGENPCAVSPDHKGNDHLSR